jgi:aspartate-semialdehyde dehydrogenase
MKEIVMIDVAILGATGAVGQRFIQRLQGHPWFRVAEVVASERSAQKTYAQATRWVLNESIPAEVAPLTVLPLESPLRSRIVFSALPSDAAKEVEIRLAAAGHFVFSNASTYRMAQDVPILLPEANAEHVGILGLQQSGRGWSGALITNSNCTAAPVVMALAPLRQFRPEVAHLVSLQAVSGAGYPGVPTLDIMDNVIPYIPSEEEKLAQETLKMLGTYQEDAIQPYPMTVSASCNRVPVLDGHIVCVAVRFAESPRLDEIQAAWRSFCPPPAILNLPSAPAQPVIYREEKDRPQTRRDRDAGGGMSTVIGRLRPAEALGGVQFVALAHNTIRGAAGCSILNAEYCLAQGRIPDLTVN